MKMKHTTVEHYDFIVNNLNMGVGNLKYLSSKYKRASPFIWLV